MDQPNSNTIPDAAQETTSDKAPPMPQGTYLDNDDVLIVNRTMARAYGLNESVVLRQLHYWLRQYAKTKKMEHFRDGHWWVYNTYEQWQTDNFDFWSENTIRRTLTALEDLGVIRSTSQYNTRPGDQTKWYTVDYAAHEAYMRLWSSHLCPTAGNGHASTAYKDFMETWDKHRSDPAIVSSWTDQLLMMSSPTAHDGQTVTRDYSIETTKQKTLIAERDESSDPPKRKRSGKRSKAIPPASPSDPIKDALNTLCFKGSGGGYLLGPLTSWLKGEADHVTANGRRNSVRQVAPQSVEDIAAFAADYAKKRKSTGEALTMPRHVTTFVLAYLDWMDARRPKVSAPVAPIDYSSTNAALDAAVFEVG